MEHRSFAGAMLNYLIIVAQLSQEYTYSTHMPSGLVRQFRAAPSGSASKSHKVHLRAYIQFLRRYKFKFLFGI
jgi:hypothetical protein